MDTDAPWRAAEPDEAPAAAPRAAAGAVVPLRIVDVNSTANALTEQMPTTTPAPPPHTPGPWNEPLSAAPAELGRTSWWRRLVAPSRDGSEIAPSRLDRELLASLRRPLDRASGPYRIVATSLKGGVGKTTVSACLGLVLAQHRCDRVLAADLNLHAGTLADRLVPGVPRATVQHLLDELLDPDVSINAIGDIDRYIEVADRLSVLAGHKDPSIGAAFAGDDVAELMGCLHRFFHIVVGDCGTGLADDAMQPVLRQAQTLVVVATATPDAAGLAEETLSWLDDHDYGHLAANTIAVISGHSDSGTARQLRSRFEARCRAVVDIPADPFLERGEMITLEALSEATHRAYLRLAAAAIDAAPEGFRR